MADSKKCNSDDDPSNAVEAGNLADDDDFLADIVKPMRPFSECHLRPYLYEPNHDKTTKTMTIVHSFERNRNMVNTLTEQVHCHFPVASSGELVSNSVEPKGTAMTIHGDQSSVPEDQTQQDFSTSSRDTYQNFPGQTLDCCESSGSVRTYAKLTSLTEPSRGATDVSYTSLKNQMTDSCIHVSTTSDSFTLLPNGHQNAYNISISDSNEYNNTLPGSTVYNDVLPLPSDSITRPTIAILRSCERRSEVESGHYSTLDHCDGVMGDGIYDTIQDMKYHTVCTTSPASTKQQHEEKAKSKTELEAAKQKTMTPSGVIELKTSTNEVY